MSDTQKGWRWAAGMLAVRVKEPEFVSEGLDASVMVGRSFRVHEVTGGRVRCTGETFRLSSDVFAPDFTDPGTLGCLRAQVQEAYFDPTKLWKGYVEVQRDQREIFFCQQPYHNEAGGLEWRWLSTGSTEAGALLEALRKARKE